MCEDVLSKFADDVGLISLLQTPTESPANSIAEMRRQIQQLSDEYATLQMKRSECLLPCACDSVNDLSFCSNL